MARREQSIADGGGNARERKMRQRRADLGAGVPATRGSARVSKGTPVPKAGLDQQQGLPEAWQGLLVVSNHQSLLVMDCLHPPLVKKVY